MAQRCCTTGPRWPKALTKQHFIKCFLSINQSGAIPTAQVGGMRAAMDPKARKPDSQRAREPENPRTREPENPRTREPENPKTQEPENPRDALCSYNV